MRSFVRTKTVVPDRLSKDNLDHTQFTIREYISVGIRYLFGKLGSVEEREKRRQAEIHRKKMQELEDVKGAVLEAIYSNLVTKDNLEITLAVNREFKSQLEEVLNHSDFSPFNIEILEEDKDVLACFSALPIMIRVTKRVLGGASNGI